MTSLSKTFGISALCSLSLLCAPAHAMVPRAKALGRILAVAPKAPARLFAQQSKQNHKQQENTRSSQWSTKTLAILGLTGLGATVAQCDNGSDKKIDAKDELVTLRNGTKARKARVDEVWKSLEGFERQYECRDIWGTSIDCHNNNIFPCDLTKVTFTFLCDCNKETRTVGNIQHDASCKSRDLVFKPRCDEELIKRLDAAGISKDGTIDEETKNIINSSFHGSMEPKFPLHKRYPVRSCYESIPFYNIYKLYKGN